MEGDAIVACAVQEFEDMECEIFSASSWAFGCERLKRRVQELHLDAYMLLTN